MNYSTIKKIISENPEIAEFGQYGMGISNEWIKRAQERLGIKFPPSYVWWLKKYSGGEINGVEVFSVYEIDFDTVVGGDIVYINEINRKNGTSSIEQLVIQEGEYGESYYFNLLKADEKGEYPVFVDITGEKYANNFLDFLQKKIEE